MIEIYDDFLDSEEFEFVRYNMLGNEFSWYLGEVLSEIQGSTYPCSCDPLHNAQMCHWFYKNYQPTGPEFSIVEPIISKLNISSLVRIKANMSLKTDTIIKHGFHRDATGVFMVAIYYVNTNDGYTEFDDGTQVESIENRLVLFNSETLHTGTTCTNAKVRCVINFNYYPQNYGA